MAFDNSDLESLSLKMLEVATIAVGHSVRIITVLLLLSSLLRFLNNSKLNHATSRQYSLASSKGFTLACKALQLKHKIPKEEVDLRCLSHSLHHLIPLYLHQTLKSGGRELKVTSSVLSLFPAVVFDFYKGIICFKDWGLNSGLYTC